MSTRDTTSSRSRARDEARALFAHTMTLVAIAAAFFAGAPISVATCRPGAGILWFIAAFACLFGIRFASQRSEQLSIGLLFGFGVLIGLAMAPTIAYYAKTDPQAVCRRAAHRAVHRRVRRGRLCDQTRPVGRSRACASSR